MVVCLLVLGGGQGEREKEDDDDVDYQWLQRPRHDLFVFLIGKSWLADDWCAYRRLYGMPDVQTSVLDNFSVHKLC